MTSRFIRDSLYSYKINLIDKFADFESKSTTKEVLIFFIYSTILGIGFAVIAGAIACFIYGANAAIFVYTYILQKLPIIYGMIVPSIMVRRFHDTNRSGRSYFLFILHVTISSTLIDLKIPQYHNILYQIIIYGAGIVIFLYKNINKLPYYYKTSCIVIAKYKAVLIVCMIATCLCLPFLPINATCAYISCIYSAIKILYLGAVSLMFLIIVFRKSSKGYSKYNPPYSKKIQHQYILGLLILTYIVATVYIDFLY